MADPPPCHRPPAPPPRWGRLYLLAALVLGGLVLTPAVPAGPVRTLLPVLLGAVALAGARRWIHANRVALVLEAEGGCCQARVRVRVLARDAVEEREEAVGVS